MSTDTTSEKKFEPDFQIAKLSGFGIIGFIIGCLFIFYDDLLTIGKRDSVFHEISYQPRVYVDSIVSATIDSLSEEIIKTKNKLNEYPHSDTSKKIKGEIDSLSKKVSSDTILITKISTYNKHYENLSIVDSGGFIELNKVLHFQITPDSIKRWDESFSKKEFKIKIKNGKKETVILIDKIIIDSVKCYLKDPLLRFKMERMVKIEAKKFGSDIDFITKYTSAGIWLILVLIFCSFCFISIPTCIHYKRKISMIFSNENQIELNGKYYIITLITAIVFGFMAFIWNRTFYDDDIVKNLFFMKHLNVSMTWVIILGSLTGAFCLSGFIYSASMVKFFADPVVEERNNIETLKVDLANLKAIIPETEERKQAIASKQNLLEAANKKLSTQESDFKKLTNIFQNYFLLAATILSLMVLCTGALFTTINSLDFVKLLADDWGYSPVRNDYIYLYGGLYTVILLLVYVPAKMRFKEVDADVWGNKGASTTENAKWQDLLKDPFGKIKDVLVATSPLLVTFIKSLFDILFN